MNNQNDNRSYQSGNSKYKSNKKKSSFGKVFSLMVILLVVFFYFLFPIITNKENDVKNGRFSIEEIIYNLPSEQREKDGITFLGTGHKIKLSFVTDRLDTISGNGFDKIAQIINFKITNYSGESTYNYENAIVYPCERDVIFRWGNEISDFNSDFESFTFDFNGNSVSIGSGNIIDKVKVIPSDEFINFKKDKGSDCPTLVEIIEVSEPNPQNNCNFYVFTNHPNNLKNDSILLADSTVLTYFHNDENEYVEISVNGKSGTFLQQNEFELDSTLKILNVWVRTNKNKTPIFYSGNGKFIQECKKIIEGCTNPKAPNYNPNATIDNGSCEQENIFKDEDKNSKTDIVTIDANNTLPISTFSCSNCGTRMSLQYRVLGDENISISCKKDIITDLVQQTITDGNTDRLEDYWDYAGKGTKCVFNGSDVSSSWWGIFRAENLELKNLTIKRNGMIKHIEIKN